LHNSSIDDFVIIEYRDTLGGRVAHTDFGKDENGKPYKVELGANWVSCLCFFWKGMGSSITDFHRYKALVLLVVLVGTYQIQTGQN